MFFHQDATIESLFVHHVGNKANDEYFSLSEAPINIEDDTLSYLLMQYYMRPFIKANEVYRLHHLNAIDLNVLYNAVTKFFENIIDFQNLSNALAKHLFDISEHPKIKPGELHVVWLKNVQMEGEGHEAIGIFKTEIKNPVLKINPKQSGYQFGYIEDTINIDALDKGVIIINTESEEGYKVLITDNKSSSDALYWKDEFLKVITRNDSYQKTTNFLKVYKGFVNDKLDEHFDLEPHDKIELLNSGMNYFQTHESFDSEEFNQTILPNEEVSTLFEDYKSNFESDFETEIGEEFDVSSSAVKKSKPSYKGIIKLDKNFHVYIHGKKDLLEYGFDEEKGMKYYKLFFENES